MVEEVSVMDSLVQCSSLTQPELIHQKDSLKTLLDSVQVKLDSLQDIVIKHNRQLEDSIKEGLIKSQRLQNDLLQTGHHLGSPLVIGDEQQQLGTQTLVQHDINILEPRLADVDFPKDVSLLSVEADPVPAITEASLPRAELPKTDYPKGITDYQLPPFPSIDSSSFSGENLNGALEEQILKQENVAALGEQVGVGGDPFIIASIRTE